MDTLLKNAPGHASRDVNVRTFQIVRLKFLKEPLGEKVDAEEDIRKKTMNICDCSTLTFCEFGNFRVQRGECRNFRDSCVFEKSENISSIEKTNESLLYLTNEVLLRDGDTASHCPLMVWLEPADLFNQEKKCFQSAAGRKEGRSRQEEGRSEGEESKGKG